MYVQEHPGVTRRRCGSTTVSGRRAPGTPSCQPPPAAAGGSHTAGEGSGAQRAIATSRPRCSTRTSRIFARCSPSDMRCQPTSSATVMAAPSHCCSPPGSRSWCSASQSWRSTFAVTTRRWLHSAAWVRRRSGLSRCGAALMRAHGADWATVAGRWHALWTSPAFADWSIVDELAAVRRPVYAMHGLHDELAPALHADALLGAVPGVRVRWVDAATHDPHRAEPRRFVADLNALWHDAESRVG